MLNAGDFFGEGCLAGQPVRMGAARATTDSAILLVDKRRMIALLHRQHAMSDRFIAHMLARNIQIEEDLIDQLFNSSEKRLARTLLLLARYGKHDKPIRAVPPDLAGDAGGNGRHHSFARELLHEEIRAPRIHQLQERTQGQQLAAHRRTARLAPTAGPLPAAAIGTVARAIVDACRCVARWPHRRPRIRSGAALHQQSSGRAPTPLAGCQRPATHGRRPRACLRCVARSAVSAPRSWTTQGAWWVADLESELEEEAYGNYRRPVRGVVCRSAQRAACGRATPSSRRA